MIELFVLAYLVGTLSATGFAKLHQRRGTALGLIRESVVPGRVVNALVWCISITELVLAGGLAAGVLRAPLLWATGSLFVVFAAYHVAVARRTRQLMCSCIGPKQKISPASTPAVAGTCFGNILPAGAACWFACHSGTATAVEVVVLTGVWLLPCVVWALARGRRHNRVLVQAV